MCVCVCVRARVRMRNYCVFMFSTIGIQKYPQFPLKGHNMKKYYELCKNNVVVLYCSYSLSL